MRKRVSLKTIAEEVGVSHVTVSLALRNHPKIPESTRNKIKKIAERLGYHRDPEYSVLMARMRLKQEHTPQGVFAWVNLHQGPSLTKKWLNYYRLILGAHTRASELNYKLEVFDCGGPGYTPRQLNSVLRARGIEGVIITPPADGVHSLDLNWKHYAAILMGNCQFEPTLSRIYFSEYENMLSALTRIKEFGYERIGLVMSQGTIERVNYSWSSAYLGFSHHFLQREEIPILHHSPHVTRDQFVHWFKKYRPEVVVANEYPIKNWLESIGETVPTTVGHVRMDNTPDDFDPNNSFIKKSNWKNSHIRYSGINQEHERLGAGAVDFLLATLYRGEYGVPKHAKTIMIQGSWVKGQSLIPQRKLKRKKSD
ncbi:MAG: LacI family DNA-binding transcriptional regulator [Verrucomicrobiota bacterium]